jgi:hypothetical protein
VKSVQTDELRDALRREIQHIEPVGLGVETVQRRGRGRRNRGRAVVAVATVTCVAGLGVAVTHHQGAQQQLAVAAQSGSATAPTLEFRAVPGAVSYTSTHFTTPGGVTYQLSTAPGTASTPDAPDQAIYSTSDGEHWTTANQQKSWIADLTERDGVLYAVGSAPGATANDVAYRLATSHDGGQAWTESDLPFDVTAPNATVALTKSASVQVARGSSTSIALLTENYWPNLDALVAERTAGHPNVTTRQTNAGFDIIDLSQCIAAKTGIPAKATSLEAPARAQCADPRVLGTITWSQIGLTSASDLRHEQMLVSTDGTHWDTATAPAATFVRDLVATSDGFLLLAENNTDPVDGSQPMTMTTLLHSTDARNWTTVPTPGNLNVEAIAGDRVLGVDGSGTVQTSTDGGQTWQATSIGSRLPAGAPAAGVNAADAGPLGFAVLATADATPTDNNPGHDYLLFSTDGITWSTSDLAAIGEPAASNPIQVTVGADHVSVDYESTAAQPTGPLAITTLLGTPKR